jgi:hypothetical protein
MGSAGGDYSNSAAGRSFKAGREDLLEKGNTVAILPHFGPGNCKKSDCSFANDRTVLMGTGIVIEFGAGAAGTPI